MVGAGCRARIRGLVLAFGCALASAAPLAAQPAKPAEFQTAAPFAILVEAATGAVLFEKAADEPMEPSSMAKLMTAEVIYQALRDKRLAPEQEVRISEDAWRRGGAPARGSAMYAPLGSKVQVQDLLRSLVIQSGNDAAIALAEALAGSEPAFAKLMTQRARALGLMQSTFTNATGLPDPGLRMTARELARLARHIIETYPEHYPVYAEREFTWNGIRQQNRNTLLAAGIGVDGLKTGYAREAGYGMVVSAVQGTLRLIAVVNGLKSIQERNDEARKLIEWGFRSFEARELFAAGETVGAAAVFGGTKGRVALVADKPVRVSVLRAGSERLSARVVYVGPVRAPVSKGQPVGTLKISRGNLVTLEVPLRTAEAVEVGPMPRRALDAATELLGGLFRTASP